jgi:hypothetical protein
MDLGAAVFMAAGGAAFLAAGWPPAARGRAGVAFSRGRPHRDYRSFLQIGLDLDIDVDDALRVGRGRFVDHQLVFRSSISSSNRPSHSAFRV